MYAPLDLDCIDRSMSSSPSCFKAKLLIERTLPSYYSLRSSDNKTLHDLVSTSLNSPNSTERCYALLEICKHEEFTMSEILLECFQSKDDEALSLLSCLEDQEEKVRISAIYSLCDIALRFPNRMIQRRIVVGLFESLTDPSHLVILEAIQALELLLDTFGPERISVETETDLFFCLICNENPLVSSNTVSLLTKIGYYKPSLYVRAREKLQLNEDSLKIMDHTNQRDEILR